MKEHPLGLQKIAELLRDARSLPPDALAALVFPSTILGNTSPGDGFWTVAHNPEVTGRDGVTSESYVVWIRKRTGGVFSKLIGVGRTRNNDIVLPFEDISKYHAYFSPDDDGDALSVADAGSKNGTFLNGVRLDAKKSAAIRSGDAIAFGKHGGLLLARDPMKSVLASMAE